MDSKLSPGPGTTLEGREIFSFLMKVKLWVFKLPNKQRIGYTKCKEENERMNIININT
jgi:hypothetical protein